LYAALPPLLGSVPARAGAFVPGADERCVPADSGPEPILSNWAPRLSLSGRHGRKEFQYQGNKAWRHRWITAQRPLGKGWQVVLNFGGARPRAGVCWLTV